MQAGEPSVLERASHLMALVNGGAMARAVAVAAELGVANHLKAGPKHSDELARLTGSHPLAFRRLLHALVSLDLCRERDDGAFELSAFGEPLQSDAPHSLRSWVLWCTNHMGPSWEKLKYSVQSGESVRKLMNGTNDFGHLDRDAEAAAVFNSAMSGITSLVALEAMRVYDFSKLRRIVDVGGGHGTFLAMLLQADVDLRGVLFDRSHAIPGARTTLDAAAVASRCEFVIGDFFDAVPEGADGYLLKAIVHDWDDDKSIAILGNCRRVMPDDGRLIVVERVLPERFQPNPLHHAIARADLTMLVSLGGRERTEVEFARLFAAAGFGLSGVRATGTEFSVMEGTPR